MKKVIIICIVVFICLGGLFVLFFGNTIVKKKSDKKELTYEESPFYKKILIKNNDVIYLNIWASYSPDSIERHQQLLKGKKKKIFNLCIDKDSSDVANAIKKFGIQNDITLENYPYRKYILNNLYGNYYSVGIIEVSSTKIPMTFLINKQNIKAF